MTQEKNFKVQCIIVGTLYKHQELKPSILKEIADELQSVAQPPRLNYCNPKDSLYLEDDVSRVKLIGNNVTPEALVTGLVCAVLGHATNDGSFLVQEFCFPGLNLLPMSQSPNRCVEDFGKTLLLLSGLDLVNKADNLGMELLADWITGLLGDDVIQCQAAKIVKVIVAGNSIRGSPESFTRKGYFENKRKETLLAEEVKSAVRRFDRFIGKIAKSCGVVLMPGEFDPSCHMIPQQSIHPSMLPISSKENLYGVTNPWIGKIDSRIIAGSSGQPIVDITRVTDLVVSPLEWLEKTLEWKHYAPTAPDTLSEFPFDQIDPFVMQEYPNIYFVGNMDKYETKLVKGKKKNKHSFNNSRILF